MFQITEKPQNEKVNIISQHVLDTNNASQSINSTVNTSEFIMADDPNSSQNMVIISEANFSCLENNYATGSQIETKLDLILANQDLILQHQAIIMSQLKYVATKNNQDVIIQQLATNQASLDKLGNYLTASSSRPFLPSKQKDVESVPSIEQLNTVDELNELERKLQNKTTMDDYVEKLSYVCGRKGIGISNCYTLVDRVFSRNLMTFCSWAGGARDEKEKIPFKMYKNVITMFFKVIHLSDRDFTFKDCEDFFKNVVRNSTRRNESNMVRNSAVKRRPKNLGV